jgi:hypothetical protein
MMKITYTVLIFIFITATSLFAQAPSIKWQKCLGGLRDDNGHSMVKTSDGGYILAGTTYSYEEDVQGNHPDGHSDLWVVKLTSLGSIEWQKCLGGNEEDGAVSITQTTDDGYIVAGSVFSDSGDVVGNHGRYDIWVVKMTTSGSIEWKKCLGGSDLDHPSSIIQTLDGGYVIAGNTNSYDGDVSGKHQNNKFSNDAWVIKLTSAGQIQWQKPLGGSGSESAQSILQLSDSSFVFVGSTTSNDGDVSGIHGDRGFTDGWLVKISSTGNLLWQKCIGGDSGDYFANIITTKDAGFVVTGTTNRYGKSWDEYQGDLWVLKLDSIGTTKWQRVVAGNQGDFGGAVTQSIDGGYIVSGVTNSDNEDFGNHGENDIILLKLTPQGAIEWRKCYGGSETEYPFSSVIQNENGSIVIGGYTRSQNGDVSGRHGITRNFDFWIAELTTPESVDEKISPLHSLLLSTYPNPASKSITLRYTLPTISSDVTISITDITGKQMRELHQAYVLEGNNEVSFDVSELSEGTYYITVSSEGVSETTAVQVVK